VNNLLDQQKSSLNSLYNSGSVATEGLGKALEEVTNPFVFVLFSVFVSVLRIFGYRELASRAVLSVGHKHDFDGKFLEMPKDEIELEVNGNGQTTTTWTENQEENGLIVAIRGSGLNTIAGRCYKLCVLVWDTRKNPPEQIHTGLGIHQS